MLRKGVYPYEYIDGWEGFDETSLPEKEDFYSDLNMEDITDLDYTFAKKVWKNVRTKNLGEYHDFYIKSYSLLLAGVFESFRNKCFEI